MTDKKSFNAGFSAGYDLGQFHAGEGGYWLEPPTRDKAWEEFITPKKKFRKKKEVQKPKLLKKIEKPDDDIPY